MVGETGFEPATPWSRTGLAALAPVSPECTERQAADFVEPRDPPGLHAPHDGAPNLDAWTAGGLREGIPPLPAPGAEIFLQAGAVVAARLEAAATESARIEQVIQWAAAQAARALSPDEVRACSVARVRAADSTSQHPAEEPG